MGDERDLRYEILDAARGKAPRTDYWKREQGLDSYFSGLGSQNIWLMRFATQALMGKEVPWEAVYHYQLGTPPGTKLVARGGTVQVTSEPASDDRVYTPGFGGTEFMSTIYWVWHMMSHIALIRAKGAIAERARRWAVLNWVLFRAIQAPDGSLMLFGQRSAGHNPVPRDPDWLFALASGGDVGRAEKWCKKAGAGLRRSWTFEVGNEFKREMQETWRESLAIPVEDLPKLLPLRVPTEIVRTTEGIAVVHATRCNSNTPPILAGTLWGNGRRDILPTSVVNGQNVPGGTRKRQQADQASARIEGGEIIYSSSLYTDGAERRIPLPGGDVIHHLKLGSGSTAPVQEPEPEPLDITTEPQTQDEPPFPDLLHAAELIAKLQLPNKMQQLRASIVSRLKSGDVDDDALAEIVKQVESFGINPAQPQAAAVREAIAILQS